MQAGARAAGAALGSVIQASTRSGNRASTSATIRGPARSAWPCLRIPRPVSRSRQSLNVGFASLDDLADRPGVVHGDAASGDAAAGAVSSRS